MSYAQDPVPWQQLSEYGGFLPKGSSSKGKLSSGCVRLLVQKAKLIIAVCPGLGTERQEKNMQLRGSESVSHSVMSDSLQHHGLQTTRLLCPWNSPGKNTGVGSIPFSRGKPRSPALQVDSLPYETPGKLQMLAAHKYLLNVCSGDQETTPIAFTSLSLHFFIYPKSETSKMNSSWYSSMHFNKDSHYLKRHKLQRCMTYLEMRETYLFKDAKKFSIPGLG